MVIQEEMKRFMKIIKTAKAYSTAYIHDKHLLIPITKVYMQLAALPDT